MMKSLEHRPPLAEDVEAIWKIGGFRAYAEYRQKSYKLDKLVGRR